MLTGVMRVVVLGALVSAMPALAQTAADLAPPQGCDVIARGAGGAAAEARAAVFPPTQLEVRTPVSPTLFPAAGRDYLLYELYLTSFSEEAMPVRGIEILDADDDAMRVVGVLTEPQLKERLRMVGAEAQGDRMRLGAGQGAIVSLCLAFDAHQSRIHAGRSADHGQPGREFHHYRSG